MKTHIHDNLPYTLFTSIKFVAPSIWPKCMAETCSSVVLHVNYKHCAANWQWNCAYRTAAQKVNSSRRIVTDRLKKEISIKFVVPWKRPKCMVETCSSVVLHVNYKHCAASWQWNCAYRTAAQKVNSSRRIVTDRLKKDCNLWNCCCQLKKGKF